MVGYMDFTDLKDKHQKADVFDCVNNTFLHAKGDQRRILRGQFMNVWKKNKNIGVVDLFMALYNSIDTLDSWERSLRNDVDKGLGYSVNDIQEKMMPFLTYKKLTNGIKADMDDLYLQIEELEETKVTQKDMDEALRDQRRELEEEHRDALYRLEKKYKMSEFTYRKKISAAEASEANAVKMYEMASKCATLKDD